MQNLSLLSDFLWKLLIIVSISSFIIFAVFLLLQPFLRKTSGGLYNRLSQISLVTVALSAVSGFFLLLLVDQDIQVKCFGTFAAAQGSFGITRILSLIWSLGVLGLGCRDILQMRAFKKRVKASLLSQQSFFSIVKDTLPPLSYGFFKGRILIPQKVVNDPSLYKFVLSHEMVHVKNHDGLWALVGLIVQRLTWFNPLAIIFERGRVLAMEMATDEEVILINNFQSQDYAQAMLTVLAQASEPKTLFANSGFRGAALSFAEMKVRLQSLQNMKTNASTKRSRYLMLGLMAAGWILGMSEALASIKLAEKSTDEGLMCYQIQHEKIIESWFRSPPDANKCE